MSLVVKEVKQPNVWAEKSGFIFFTDFHAHLFMDFSKPDTDFVTDRFRAQVEALEGMFKRAQKENLGIVFGGDLFHQRRIVDVRVYNAVFDVFSKYTKVPVVMVRGNHDSVTNSLYTESSLDSFDKLDHIDVASVPTLYTVNGTYAYMCLPYGDEIDEMKSCLQEAKTLITSSKRRDLVYLIGHIGVDGSETGRYSHTLSGAFTVKDLDPDIYTRVLLGHYHKRQFLGGLPNVLYGGNPIQQSFSDEGQTKGYHIISYFADEGGVHEELSFEAIPQKTFITLDVNNLPDDDSIILDNYVQIKGNPTQVKHVKALQEQEGATNIRVTVQKEYKVEVRQDIQIGDTPNGITTQYLETKHASKELKELANTLISKALDL